MAQKGKRAIKLSTPQEVRKALSKVANMVLNGEIDSKIANSFTLICNSILGAIRTDEQEKKIAELEQLLNNHIK